MDNIEIVSLRPEEWQLYKELRLRALKEEPQAFGSTYEENLNHPDAYWKQRLEDSFKKDTQWLLFARLNNQLIGMIGAYLEKEDQAEVIAMYVMPETRGKGISKLLMKELIKKIKINNDIKKIIITVNPEQKAALHLYHNVGFQLVSQEKDILGDGKEHKLYKLQMLTSEV